MERILPDSVYVEIESFGFDSECLLFPIRHHSPVCSYQLLRTIREYGPDIILVEGPDNANDLIPVLTDEETKLPAAFYYFYKDKKKLISDEAEDYKCYYPFLNSSPEYNALKEAKRLGIPAFFIDLPYSEIMIGTSSGEGFRRDAEKHNYADDTGFLRNKFYQKICEKTGLRSFEEFWEKYFEISGLYKTPREFLRQMHTYCSLIREDVTDEELALDGTTIREQYMAARIIEKKSEYKKILVVTGGFHSRGLAKLLSEGDFTEPKLHKIPVTDQGSYPMAYSYEAADAMHGYASGMSTPFFYDEVMKRLLASLESGEESSGIYNELTMDLLVRTSKECAKKDIPVSMSDVTSALSLMQGLSALRNSYESGMFELVDAITSTFIKGEKTISSSYPLSILNKLATGKAIGSIGDKSHVPPLITDFETQCDRFGLNYTSVIPRQVDISLFTSERGLEESRFLHRMDYLGTGFADMKKGPNLHKNTDRSRIREEWRYRRTPEVDAALIDHITDGFTILDACTSLAMKKLRSERMSENAAKVAVDCFLMGIPLQSTDYQLIDEIIINDSDFFSIGEALHHFDNLHNLQTLYHFEDNLYEVYRNRCFDKVISALPSIANVNEEKVKQCTSIMRTVYSIVQKMDVDKQEAYYEALLALVDCSEKEATVYGAAIGILYASDSQFFDMAQSALRGFLLGSTEVKKQGAKYLKGLFGSARDVMLADDTFLRLVNELLSDMDTEDFMEILPNLRFAFSYFTPMETQQIAKKVASVYEVDSDDILHKKGVDEFLAVFGEKIDLEVCSELERRMDVYGK